MRLLISPSNGHAPMERHPCRGITPAYQTTPMRAHRRRNMTLAYRAADPEGYGRLTTMNEAAFPVGS